MRNLHQEVTDRIIAGLETGAAPWIRPWSQTHGRNVPANAVSGREYQGINKVLLWITSRHHDWPTPRFLTFKQALALGGHVRKGEHGTKIYFVKDLHFEDIDPEGGDESGLRKVRMLREYTVFNTFQCDCLPACITDPPALRPRNHDGPDPEIEDFLAVTSADIRKSEDGGCAYLPRPDFIEMMPLEAFKSADCYYAALFHELVHWTGAKHRLDRNLTNRFTQSQQYAAEELIAELGSAFLCAEFSIDGYSSHASYIANWLSLLEQDSRAIFTCASKAQAALDFLRELALREPAQAAE